jgi:hypothetical protein
MAMRIRVTTRADLFEKRKKQHIERGYRIEDERPIPVNGFSSFIAVSEIPIPTELASSWRRRSMDTTVRTAIIEER